MCHSINCEGRCRRHMQRLLTQEVLGGSASLLDILLTIKIPWKTKSCVARCRRRDLTFPSEEWIIASFAHFEKSEILIFFFVGVSCWVISDRPGNETQNWPLCFILYDQTFLSEPGTINCPASRFNDTQLQAIGKANNNTLFFFISTEQVVEQDIACRRESHGIIQHSYLFTVSRPNVEGNVVDISDKASLRNRKKASEITRRERK